MYELEKIGGECVPVLVQEAPRVVEDDAGKVVEPERGVDVRLGLQVVAVGPVTLVEFVQEGLVRTLNCGK